MEAEQPITAKRNCTFLKRIGKAVTNLLSNREFKLFSILLLGFLVCYFLPTESLRFQASLVESMVLVKDYAREHVLTCLLPAFFIAGALTVFINKATVLKYLGASAPKPVAYGVASISGCILAVCSCTVLPLFSGIYRIGAGLGPASAFLYAGPAINVLAMAMTARVLGTEIGIARSIGAIIFSVVIGLCMHLIFRKEDKARTENAPSHDEVEGEDRVWKGAAFFASLVAILVFANFGSSSDAGSLWQTIYQAKWLLTAFFTATLFVILSMWFGFVWWHLLTLFTLPILLASMLSLTPYTTFVIGLAGFIVVMKLQKSPDSVKWLNETWTFAKQILPLLLGGVIIAGFLLGGPFTEGIIPNEWVQNAVGGNSIAANFLASLAGAFMYFATLTEVPILQGLLSGGMGKGPALALLLAGPALSLPNMLVIKSILGTKKTVVFVTLVVTMSTLTGIIYGNLM